MAGREYTYDYKTICAEFDDSVCLLTLDRPDKRNAMNPVLGEEITDALEKLRNDKRCRVLVITGAGESFCAGMDLKEFFIDLQDVSRIRPCASCCCGMARAYFTAFS